MGSETEMIGGGDCTIFPSHPTWHAPPVPLLKSPRPLRAGWLVLGMSHQAEIYSSLPALTG